MGHCSLSQLIKYKIEHKISWNLQDIIYIVSKMIELCLKLYKNDKFYSDWKPNNIVFSSTEKTYLTKEVVF